GRGAPASAPLLPRPFTATGSAVRSRRAHDPEEAAVYARVATFQSDPADIDRAIEMVRTEVAGDTPAGLEGARMLMLVDRASGKGVGITLFDSEEPMRRGDEALNAMSPGATERRTSVEFFEVPVQTVKERGQVDRKERCTSNGGVQTDT